MRRIVIAFILSPLLFPFLESCKSADSFVQTENIVTVVDTIKYNGNVVLKDVYKQLFPIGTAVYYRIIQDQRKRTFIAKQYASITPEIELKPRIVHPEENTFDFSKADSVIAFAQKNNMRIRGHCLLWYYRMPDWFFKENGKMVSKATLLGRMENHISTIVKRYKGTVYCWDVVNEAVDGNGNAVLKHWDTFYKILGEQYIEEAFKMAKKADPSAKLFYNDFYDTKVKRDKIISLLKRLKAKGVPIDGIGIQGHYGLNGFTEQSLKEDIALFKDIGLEIQFTEIDITIFDREGNDYKIKKSHEIEKNIFEKQAKQYEILFRACRNEPAVTGITMWGAADWHNFLNDKLKEKPYPYLFTETMKPKPAFFAVTDF